MHVNSRILFPASSGIAAQFDVQEHVAAADSEHDHSRDETLANLVDGVAVVLVTVTHCDLVCIARLEIVSKQACGHVKDGSADIMHGQFILSISISMVCGPDVKAAVAEFEEIHKMLFAS